MLVVDASVVLAWCFEDEATAATELLLDEVAASGAIAPGLLLLEVANVLVAGERRGRLTEAHAVRLVALLGDLPIDVDPGSPDLGRLVAVARRHELSSYDAAYLELAERTGASLATLDRPLAEAARSAGVEVRPS
jgi:predicted nucleic acid-binding protein